MEPRKKNMRLRERVGDVRPNKKRSKIHLWFGTIHQIRPFFNSTILRLQKSAKNRKANEFLTKLSNQNHLSVSRERIWEHLWTLISFKILWKWSDIWYWLQKPEVKEGLDVVKNWFLKHMQPFFLKMGSSQWTLKNMQTWTKSTNL